MRDEESVATSAPQRRPLGTRRNAGLTLVELLVVVAIVAVLVAIALPLWLDAVNDKKTRQTMGDMRRCGTANESYSIDHLQYVASGERGIGGLRSHFEPTYAKSLPARDGWEMELRYIGVLSEYTITSYGSDRRSGGGGAISAHGTTTNFKNDLVFSTGSFAQYPDGMTN
jgi:general secretion pathway protein G